MANLNELLKYLTKVKRGDPVTQAARSDRINAIIDAIQCLARGEHIISGINVRKRSGDGYCILSGNPVANVQPPEQPTDYSFRFMDATEVDPVTHEDSNKVLVLDGKINGTFPSGMGTDEYVLDLPTPEDSLIWAGATFDPESLEITSRFLQVTTAAASPESRVDEDGGFLYWLLGFTYFDGDETFRMRNTLLGDINFELIYGALNGKPALLPVMSGPGWLDLTSILE